jgi:hypothetical protein
MMRLLIACMLMVILSGCQPMMCANARLFGQPCPAAPGVTP